MFLLYIMGCVHVCRMQSKEAVVNRKKVRVEKPVFMFGLRVVDAEYTDEADVFLYDMEAEYALGGITAQAFHDSPRIQEVIKSAFDSCIDRQIYLDFYIWSYKVPRQKDGSVGVEELDLDASKQAK